VVNEHEVLIEQLHVLLGGNIEGGIALHVNLCIENHTMQILHELLEKVQIVIEKYGRIDGIMIVGLIERGGLEQSEVLPQLFVIKKKDFCIKL
jgi:hypothetical protein